MVEVDARRPAVAGQERLANGNLIRVADAQIDRAKSDLSIARLGLAEVELELTTRGLRSSDPGPNGEGGQAQ
jgi:hypothetical protein